MSAWICRMREYVCDRPIWHLTVQQLTLENALKRLYSTVDHRLTIRSFIIDICLILYQLNELQCTRTIKTGIQKPLLNVRHWETVREQGDLHYLLCKSGISIEINFDVDMQLYISALYKFEVWRHVFIIDNRQQSSFSIRFNYTK